jgi:hypothetical protein
MWLDPAHTDESGQVEQLGGTCVDGHQERIEPVARADQGGGLFGVDLAG